MQQKAQQTKQIMQQFMNQTNTGKLNAYNMRAAMQFHAYLTPVIGVESLY